MTVSLLATGLGKKGMRGNNFHSRAEIPTAYKKRIKTREDTGDCKD
jgi:hypothetical protein